MAPTRRRIAQQFLDCRTYSHAWKPTDVDLEGKFYVQHLQCIRCGMTRRFKIDKKTGELVGSNSYTAPKGYALEGGRLTPQERGSLRLISARSTVAQEGVSDA